jgi:hypothetical protein
MANVIKSIKLGSTGTATPVISTVGATFLASGSDMRVDLVKNDGSITQLAGIIPPATAGDAGLLTATEQEIGGVKIFTANTSPTAPVKSYYDNSIELINEPIALWTGTFKSDGAGNHILDTYSITELQSLKNFCDKTFYVNELIDEDTLKRIQSYGRGLDVFVKFKTINSRGVDVANLVSCYGEMYSDSSYCSIEPDYWIYDYNESEYTFSNFINAYAIDDEYLKVSYPFNFYKDQYNEDYVKFPSYDSKYWYNNHPDTFAVILTIELRYKLVKYEAPYSNGTSITGGDINIHTQEESLSKLTQDSLYLCNNDEILHITPKSLKGSSYSIGYSGSYMHNIKINYLFSGATNYSAIGSSSTQFAAIYHRNLIRGHDKLRTGTTYTVNGWNSSTYKHPMVSAIGQTYSGEVGHLFAPYKSMYTENIRISKLYPNDAMWMSPSNVDNIDEFDNHFDPEVGPHIKISMASGSGADPALGVTMIAFGSTGYSSSTGYYYKGATTCEPAIYPWQDNYGFVGLTAYRWYKGYFGNLYANAFYESSDENLKNILKPIETDLEELSKLRKVYFEWKDNSNGITGPQLGVIAQDIKKLYPEIVDGEEGGLTVQYDKLGVIALDAVDKLYQENKELKARCESLEKRVQRLENLLM